MNLKDSDFDKRDILYSESRANSKKEVYIYIKDLGYNEEEDVVFNVDYHIEYDNGDFQDGNAFVPVEEIFNAYDTGDYDTLRQHFIGHYKGDKEAFTNIINELKKKGLNPNVDESEGGYL